MRRPLALGCAVLSACIGFGVASPTTASATADAKEVDYHDLDQHGNGEIFMEVKATKTEIEAVRNKLLRHPAVEAFGFLDQY